MWTERRRILPPAALLLAALAADCGPGRKPVYPVEGQVFYNKDLPAAGALLVFQPVAPDDPANPLRPTATVNDDGSFQTTTYQPNDGAPEGDYTVTIVWLEESSGDTMLGGGESTALARDRLGGRYADPKAPRLTAHVQKGGPNTFRFDVE
jgi:hypothetical protein